MVRLNWTFQAKDDLKAIFEYISIMQNFMFSNLIPDGNIKNSSPFRKSCTRN